MLKPRKILYILTKADLGGVSKYLLEIAKKLSDNYKPYFLMSSEGYFSEELKKLGIKDEQIFFVPMTNSIFDLKTHITSNLQTIKIIHKIKPDIIHCNSTTGGIVGRICGAFTFKPVIFTAHGWAFSGGLSKAKIKFYEILETLLAFLTKKIICVSEHDREIALKVMPFFKNRLVTIHNGISDSVYRYNYAPHNELKLVSIIRFAPPKDPYTLINAIAELNNEGFNIVLDLYGYGIEQDKVQNLINEKNCQNIKLCGALYNVDETIINYDVYTLISDKEGLPVGIIEALRAGLPIITSDVGGCSEMIKNNGFAIPKGDKDILKQKIKEIHENRELLKEFSANSRKLYEEEFTEEKMLGKTVEVYEGIS